MRDPGAARSNRPIPSPVPESLLIPFTKYHALGNDFILVDLMDHPETRSDFAACSLSWPALALRLCDRHLGVGADGLLVLAIDRNADARMDIVNADGSDGGMCANGLRCVARHMFERWAWVRSALHVRVGDQTIPITIHASAEGFRAATVRLVPPLDVAGLRPEPIPDSLLAACEAATPGWRAACSLHDAFVSVHIPNPHAIFFCDNVARVPLDRLGHVIENHPVFPNRTNVHFVQVLAPFEARMRTWERGVGPTLACGSGACAALLAGVTMNLLQRTAIVHVPGGELRIECGHPDGVYLTGPAERVFTGVCAVSVTIGCTQRIPRRVCRYHSGPPV
jgi:diaminopimelate epimerase